MASSFFLPSVPVCPASSSDLPPFELALADVLLDDDETAENAILPLALTIFRSVVERVVSLTSATATAAPMAADSPAALPLARVVVVVACRADTLTLSAPATGSIKLLPMRAVVLLLTIANASTGVIEIPPDDPASAWVMTS